MSRLRNNVLANYAGQVWIALMGLAFVPAYLRHLGAEQFGLVAFMLSLQAISLLLDLGVGVFLSRELAQRAHEPERRESIRGLVRSFEWLVWPMACIIAITIFAASGVISSHWLKPQHLTQAATISAVQLIGLVVALLWPTSFYSAALSGLEQQPRLNVLVVLFATLRFAGVLPLLRFTNSGLQGFLCWHAAVAFIQTACCAALLWRVIPTTTRPLRFDLQEVQGARHFAMGVFTITALGLLLSQSDRLSLSALRPLQEFGLYAVALSISGGLGRLVQPMFNAIYPRLSRFAVAGASSEMTDLYHLANQIVTTTLAAIAGLICVYSESVLWLWTGDAVLAAQVAVPLTLLFAGSAINGIMNLPYALQLAHGWTSLAAKTNFISLAIAAPAYIVAITYYGMVGAASVWLVINLGNFLFGAPLMHRRLLRGELKRWYLDDVFPPMLAATAVALSAKWIHPLVGRDFLGVAWLTLVGGVALAAAALASNRLRLLMLRYTRGPRVAP